MRRVPRIKALLLLATMLLAAASHAQESSLTNHPLASDLVPGEPRFDLLLPPAYDPDRSEPYPLLLWLHGGGNGEGQLERRLRAELVHRLLFDAAIPHEYHLVQEAAHTGRSVPRRLKNVLGFFQRALRPEGPDPEAEDHLARAKRSGRYAPRVPNQLDFKTVDFRQEAANSGEGSPPP